jgi:hypothetical protein
MVMPSLYTGPQHIPTNTEYEVRIDPNGALQFVAPGSAIPPEQNQGVLVYSVNDVAIVPVSPIQWKIVAKGLASTGGWTNAHLRVNEAGNFAHDSLLDLDFLATKPNGMVTQALLPIMANFIWNYPSAQARGVRVHTSTNAMEKTIR